MTNTAAPNAASLVLTDAPDAADEALLEAGLAAYNEQKVGYRDARPLAALLKDPETGGTLGGMIGRTSYGLLFIDTVWLPDSARGQDIGTRLLAMMETEAIARGCKAGFLMTVTFQAPEFYARFGWTEFGRAHCDPPDTARVLMTKTLAP
jgi:GNAT superfamily N-acetyltransferase